MASLIWTFSSIQALVVILLPHVASTPCGTALTGSSGFLTSEHFPGNFERNKNCAWNITVPAGRIIKISFLNFTLEPNQATDCKNAFGGARLYITNVASHDNNRPDFELCGQQIPAPVYSVGNFIQVALQSSNNVFSGFKAFYEATSENDICPTMAQFNESSGVITSPFYPRRYPDHQDCIWQITANKGRRVKLEIVADMDIFWCSLCVCDNLEIQNGFDTDGAASGKLCGTPGKILTYYSVQEILTLHFVSDGVSSFQNKGFKATYTFLNFTPPVCPAEAIPLSGNGTLSSPGYPEENYIASKTCTWKITAPAGKQVKFAFTDFALGSCSLACSSETCTYVEVYDGPSASSPSLGRFCHGSALEEKFSSGNQMFVKFHSGFKIDRGFEAEYSVSSGRPTTSPSPTVITQHSTVITPSPTVTTSTSAPSASVTAPPSTVTASTSPPSSSVTTLPSTVTESTSSPSPSVTTPPSTVTATTSPSSSSVTTPPSTVTSSTSPSSASAPFQVVNSDIKTDNALLKLANKEFLSNGRPTRYIHIIVIPLKVEDQDIGTSTDEKYAAKNIDKDYETKEEGEAYITAEFDYGKTEFSAGDEKYYSRSKEGSKKYLNGKLNSNTHYAVFQRSFDDNGSYESEAFIRFQTQKSFPLVAVIVPVVVVIAVAVVIAGVLYFYKVKKRKRTLNDTRAVKFNRHHAAYENSEY